MQLKRTHPAGFSFVLVFAVSLCVRSYCVCVGIGLRADTCWMTLSAKAKNSLLSFLNMLLITREESHPYCHTWDSLVPVETEGLVCLCSDGNKLFGGVPSCLTSPVFEISLPASHLSNVRCDANAYQLQAKTHVCLIAIKCTGENRKPIAAF